jgi:hypothetical protein
MTLISSCSFTAASIFNPCSNPGPLKECIEVLLALSKEALKIRGMPSLSVILLRRFAIRNVVSWFSMTHGPAIKKNPDCSVPVRSKKKLFIDSNPKSKNQFKGKLYFGNPKVKNVKLLDKFDHSWYFTVILSLLILTS